MPKVTVTPENQVLEGTEGQRLFDLLREAKLGVETACVGKGTCGLCRVKIIEGGDSLPPLNEIEEQHLGNVYHINKVRLSCQTILQDSDMTIALVKKKRKNKSTDNQGSTPPTV